VCGVVSRLQSILDRGSKLPFSDGILINGASFNMEQGMDE